MLGHYFKTEEGDPFTWQKAILGDYKDVKRWSEHSEGLLNALSNMEADVVHLVQDGMWNKIVTVKRMVKSEDVVKGLMQDEMW